jgi:hypothetical protein
MLKLSRFGTSRFPGTCKAVKVAIQEPILQSIAQQAGVDDMILKIFSPIKWRFFNDNTVNKV